MAQRLASTMGISANLEFCSWEELVDLQQASAESETRTEALPEADLQWAITAELASLDAEQDPVFADLAAYVAPALGSRRRVLLARTLAALRHRTLLLRGDPDLDPSPGQAAWLGPLWRAVAARLGGDRHGVQIDTLGTSFDAGPPAAGPAPFDPILVFGISGVPPAYLKMLARLARHRPIHVFHRTPSVRLHDAVVGLSPEAAAAPEDLGRLLDAGGAHPLASALGRLPREAEYGIHRAAVEAGVSVEYVPGRAASEADHEAPVEADRSMLALLRADVEAGIARGRGDLAPIAVPGDDRSILFHRCHGPIRQLEVLRDELMRRFEADHSLHPRDVLVLCADLPALAPHIVHVFDGGARTRQDDEPIWGRAGFPHVRYEIADRSEFASNQVADALLRILRLPRTRFEASTLLDLLALDPVRRRFRVEETDLDAAAEWIGQAVIRWGRDAAHRVREHRPDREDFTWRLGIDRLLAGMAIQGEGLHVWEGLLPIDDVEGSAASVVGGLVEFAETLLDLLEDLDRTRTAAQWGEVVGSILDRTVRPEGPRRWQEVRVRGTVAEVLEAAGRFGVELDLDGFRAAVEASFGDALGAGRFAAGGFTFASLSEHRAVPHRVVALVGLDVDSFPRRPTPAGFDHLAAAPRIGDGLPHERDRHAFMSALLAAGDSLIVTWAGRSDTNNEPHPLSVVAAELLDELAVAYRPEGCETPDEVRKRLVIDHPLHPFDRRAFDRTDVGLGAVSVDGASHRAAAARAEVESASPPFWAGPLAADPEPIDGLELSTLTRFLKNPARILVKQRLGVQIDDEVSVVDDRDPQKLDSLAKWQVRDDAIAAQSDGRAADLQPAMRAGGRLPLGTPGDLAFVGQNEAARAVVEARRRLQDGRATERRILAVDLDGVRLHGPVDGLLDDLRVAVTASDLKPKRELEAWVEHLMVCAAEPEVSRTTWLLGWNDKGGRLARRTLSPVDADVARGHLADLVDLYVQGQRWPLPFCAEPSKLWWQLTASPDATKDPVEAAAKAWEGDFDAGKDPHVGLAFDDAVPPTAAADLGIGLPPDLSFTALARRVMEPLLAHLDEPREAR